MSNEHSEPGDAEIKLSRSDIENLIGLVISDETEAHNKRCNKRIKVRLDNLMIDLMEHQKEKSSDSVSPLAYL